MSRLPTIELDIPPGVFSDETDRGTKGRYRDCDKIRFRLGMPEKIGGWILSSFGTNDSEIVEMNYPTSEENDAPASRVRLATPSYGAAVLTIPLNTAVTVEDEDRVWLFDESIFTGTVTGAIDSYTATASANVTATAGNAVVIRYPTEFNTVAATIVAGGEAGSYQVTLSAGVTKYLRAGTLVRIQTATHIHWTKLRNNLISGATQLTLQQALPAAYVPASRVELFPVGTHFAQPNATPASSFGYVVRILANSPAASTSLIFTRPLPAAATALSISVRPFQETFVDGDQVATTNLVIAPATAFATSAGGSFPDRLVLLPEMEPEFIRYIGQVRATHDWKDLSDQQWASIGTDKKLYVINNGELFDITPLRAVATLIGPFSVTAFSFEVEVTDVAHGAQPGDYVRFSGASAVGGVLIDGEYEIQEVIDADTYTIIIADFPTSTTTGGGTVSAEYDLSAGLEDSAEVEGWGTGDYGGGPYGIGQAGVGVRQKLRIWSLDNFGEDLLASPSGGSLYHWDRSSGPTTRAVLVDNAPATIMRMLVSPQARHVIALGAGTGSNLAPGAPDSLFIRWSDQEDFETWAPTTTNLAGDLRLDKGSEIITAIESRGETFINTDESLHALQYIGGEFVFGLRHLGQSVSVIGPNAVVDQNGVVHFMADDDLIMYDGVLRVMPCPVHDHVFKDINAEQGYKVFASVNRAFNEVWWFYPSLIADEPDRYVKYNYLENVWDFGTMDRTAYHDKSLFLGAPYAFFDGLMWQHETGVDETDEEGILQPMISYITSGDLEIAQGGRETAHVGAMIPDFKTLVGDVELTVDGKRDPQATRNITRGPFTVTSSTERVAGVHLKARQLGFTVRSSNIGDNWRMGKWKAETKMRGRRKG